MTTTRRDIRLAIFKKLEELVSRYVIDIFESSIDYEKSADEIADAVLEVINKKPAKPTNDPVWNFLHGVEVTQEELDENVASKEARDNFEVSFSFNPPWFSNKDWTDFAKFVASVYKQDKNVWRDYCLWREDDGKYNGKMTNVAIRNNPKAFMDTGYPTFEARKMYWKPPVRTESSQPESTIEDDGNIYV